MTFTHFIFKQNFFDMYSEAPVAVGTIVQSWISSSDRNRVELTRAGQGSLFTEAWGDTRAYEIEGEASKLSAMELAFTRLIG